MVTSPVRDAVAVLTLVVLTNGPLFFIERKGLDLPGTWEGPIVRPMIVGTVLLSVFLVAFDSQRVSGRRLFRPNRVLMAAGVGFGAWAALSVLWSINPEPTLWRGVVYMALPLVAWVLADLSHDRFARAATVAFGSLVVVSVGLVVFWSSTGLDRNDDWKGIFTNRNGFAPVCAVAVLLGINRILEGRRAMGAGLLAVSGISLLGTGSRTAWIAVLIALGGSTLLVLTRRHMRERSGLVVPAAAIATGALGLAAVVAVVASRWDESTFVQRRTIWDLLGDHIADHPIRGSGFQAFWTVPELIGEHELLQRGSAHGSVPEILLGLGTVGLVLWAVVVLAALAGTLRWAWQQPSATSWFWLALTLLLVVENATESFVLWFSYNWVLLIVAALRAWRSPLRSPVSRSVQPSARAIS
jgi:O-antigen ligase